MSNEAIVEWLDRAAAATKPNAVDRAVVLYLAENATVSTAAAPRKVLNRAELGLTTDREIGRAFRELVERGWIKRGWILTIPSGQGEAE